ncbi:MAG: SLC26A/SulP transporter family protein, partial [Elusimicrobia bacterium]|nr:SLC26A/SulP transporter family protein [Elusimicrobiota bacterium]
CASTPSALALSRAELAPAVTTALTLSVLLSIDTLKSCVAVDALTRTRHDSDRTLLGQGAANILSALAGGVPGSGAIGATLVNVTSGGRTKLSGILSGLFTLAAFVLIGRLVAWVPSAALAGILLVVAWTMFDRKSFRLLRRRSTAFDFAVSAAVIVAAILSDLIVAAGVGLALSILLYIRAQILSSVIRRRSDGSRTFSKTRRLPDERAALERLGARTVVCELQGSLFFGTTDQLYTELEKDLPKAAFVILDMRRVTSVDFTAVHMLKQLEDVLHEHGGRILISAPPTALPSGVELQRYFDEVGLVKATRNVEVFASLDDALARAEDALLAEAGLGQRPDEPALSLAGMDLLRGLEPALVAALEAAAESRSVPAGGFVCRRGEPGDELFLVRRGRVRIDLPLEAGPAFHVTTFGRGDFFGEVVFLDRGSRSADAAALSDCEIYALSRARFDAVAKDHPGLGLKVFSRLAHTLAVRLRQSDAELRALQEA